jgi:hypothetical protein
MDVMSRDDRMRLRTDQRPANRHRLDAISGPLLRRVKAANRELADGRFGAGSNACNQIGGPLGPEKFASHRE